MPRTTTAVISSTICDEKGMIDSFTVWTYSAKDAFVSDIAPYIRNLTVVFGSPDPSTKNQTEWCTQAALSR